MEGRNSRLLTFSHTLTGSRELSNLRIGKCSWHLFRAGERLLLPGDTHCERKPHFTGEYCEWKAAMAVENLAQAISSLTPDEQESVRLFVEFLKRKDSAPSSP